MKNVLQPRWVMLAYWVLVVGLTLWLHPTTTLDWPAIALILFFSLAFTLAVAFATMKPPGPPPRMKSPPPVAREAPTVNRRVITAAIIVGSLANATAAVLAIRSSNMSIIDVLTLQGLAESANTMAMARYSLEGSGAGVALFLGMGYTAALIAPFIRLTDAKRKTLLTLLPTVTSLAYASVSSARLGFLISAALTAGGIIAASITSTGRAPRVRPKVLIAVLLSAALIASAFIGIGALRIGRVDTESINLSWQKQVIYAVGSPGAFATWFGDYGTGMDEPLGYGTATIAGMEHLTGQQRSETRAFNEFASIDTSGRKSNVYTAFRGLMLDFGIAGTLVFLAAVGFIFGRLSRRAAQGRMIAAVLVGYGYATIFLSGWLATTTFTNVLMVAVAAPLVIAYATRPMRVAVPSRMERRLQHQRNAPRRDRDGYRYRYRHAYR